ncbi:hypothetical protein KIN20_020827 [Parelaphostrongylus tenuis]|uniref:LolA-like domain-containing protein n=1 Tax=Parelaphostrongylus tenuis TaxID=148309 RepID=A0AAD5N3M4_PARTN|nr:hypothetical protein KIN20_020827 [Parelaphostrongylus tenuis]
MEVYVVKRIRLRRWIWAAFILWIPTRCLELFPIGLGKPLLLSMNLQTQTEFSTSISFRNGTSLQWLTMKADKNVFLYNSTAGHCDKTATSCLESFPEFLMVSKNLSSMASLMEGLVDFAKAHRGFKHGNKTVAGIEGVQWSYAFLIKMVMGIFK